MATTDAVPVDPTNTDQHRAWDGDEGRYWATNADRFDRGVAAHHDAFMRAATIGAADQVLDLGCGTGRTTLDAARAASQGAVLGVDLSAAMLDVARERAAAEGITNARFEQADGQIATFEPEAFDAAIARTSAMFFGDRVAALANVGRALRRGGRIVLLTWQGLEHNEWIRELRTALAAGRDLPVPPPEAPSPFSLSDPMVVDRVLTEAGYHDVTLDEVRAPMWLGHDAGDARDFVLGLMGWMLDGLDEDGRARALDALAQSTTDHETTDGVVYDSAAWIIHAVKP